MLFMSQYNTLFTKTLSPLCERGFLWGLSDVNFMLILG